MAKQNQQALAADLAKARDRLAAWRRMKEPSSRIPEALWKTAVELAAKYGVHRTARSLKLDYYSLKKRALLAEGQPAKNDSAFVELPQAFVPVPECILTLEDGPVNLRVHLKGYSATEIAVLGRGLRGSN